MVAEEYRARRSSTVSVFTTPRSGSLIPPSLIGFVNPRPSNRIFQFLIVLEFLKVAFQVIFAFLVWSIFLDFQGFKAQQFASQIRMSSPSLHDLVERLERLEIASTTASIAARRSQGPYDPPVIAPTLHTAISEICQKDEAQIDEPMKLPPSLKLPTCELPKFSGQDFPSFVDKFARFLRLSGLQQMSDQVKTDWLIQACDPQVYKIVVNTVKESQGDLEASLTKLGEIFPTLENDLTLRKKIEALPPLPYGPEPPQVVTFLLEFENLAHKLTANAWTDQDKLLALISKIHPKTFQEIRANPILRPKTDTYADMKHTLQEKVKEDWVDKKMTNPKTLQVLAVDTPMQVDSPQPTSTNVSQAGQGSHFQGRQPRQQSKGNPGKGKGKGSSKGNLPRSLSRQPLGMQKFSATIVCKHCNKVGHYDSKCWFKHPNLMPQWLKNRQERSKSKTPQRPSQPTYSPIEDETSNNPKKRKVNLFTTLALGLGAKVNGQEVETIIDSGASMTVVSNSLVHPTQIKKENALPVQVATDEILFSLGTTQLQVQWGGKSIYHTALVLPPNAFQAVLGLDFLCTPLSRCANQSRTMSCII